MHKGNRQRTGRELVNSNRHSVKGKKHWIYKKRKHNIRYPVCDEMLRLTEVCNKRKLKQKSITLLTSD